ncbi:aminopeptidase [Floccifex porci]|uniref:Aminopeptidase n=1 Tax=Floccifex porci TaxID=2606629 RepID=A0A7X2T395_9FIRM|nr:aminopeptidase [Floccifex porci]MSS01202.1 aminopeptidase [Floccifex porci]
MKEILKRLSNADAIAAREKEVRKILREEMKSYADAIQYDHLGSICFEKKGCSQNPVTIAFMAHMDEVGFFVRHISDNGFIYLIAVGGVLSKSKEMQKVRITCQNQKKIDGILNVTRDEKGNVKDMYVDVGCETGDEIRSLGIQIGDMVTFASECFEMANGNVLCGKAMDDRTGCAVLSQAIKRVHDNPGDLWFIATSSEEVGCRGGKTASEQVKADIVIAIDVANNPELVKNYTNHRLLSKGCMILHYDKTMIPNEKFLNYVKQIARENDIPFQEDMFSNGGTDCNLAHLNENGKVGLVIGIPLRYCHGSYSMVHEKDLKAALDLVCLLAEKIGNEQYSYFIDYEKE